eukprot:COSAG03_NODE_577_length_6882_cov_5.570691_2_plen_74_part_00
MPPMRLLPSVVNSAPRYTVLVQQLRIAADWLSKRLRVVVMTSVRWLRLNLQNSATLRVSLADVELLWVQRHVR